MWKKKKKLYRTLNLIFLQSTIGILVCIFVLASCSNISKILSPRKIELKGRDIEISKSEIPDTIQVDPEAKKFPTKLPYQISYSQKIANSKMGGTGNIAFRWPIGEEQNYYKMRSISFKVASNYSFPLSSMPVLTDSKKLILLDTSGVLYGFNSENGNIVWKSYSGGMKKNDFFDQYLHRYMMAGGIAIDNNAGVAFVTNGTNCVSAFNSENGKKIWDMQISSLTRSVPVVFADSIIIQGSNDTVFCLDKKNGKIKWTYIGLLEGGEVRSSTSAFPMAYEKETVLVQDIHGNVIILKADDGSELSRFDLQSLRNIVRSEENIIGYESIIYNRVLYLINNLGQLIAIKIDNGNVLWKKNIDTKQAFWIAGDLIYVVNDLGQLLAINAVNGNVHWAISLQKSYAQRRKMDKEINSKNMFSSPVMMGNNVFVVCYDGVLLGFDPRTGAKVKEIPIHNRSTLPILVQQNSFYIFSKDGVITRYFID